MSFKKNIANIVTFFRILGTVCIIFLSPLKLAFFIVYTVTGVTDLLDGLIARLSHTASAFGARLDSIADLLFYTVTLIKLFPFLWRTLPGFIWIIVGITLFFRLLSYVIAAIKFNRFAAHHTWLNKTTGLLVFAIPYFLITPCASVYCFIVCLSGVFSTAEDLYIHIFSAEYDENIKSVFHMKKQNAVGSC